MIRIVTTGWLRRLCEDADQARARAREVRGQADAAWARHIREVWELTDRAETAENDAAILRDHVFEFEDKLKNAEARAEILRECIDRQDAELECADAGAAVYRERIRLLRAELEDARQDTRSLVVLLHYGEPYSIHRSRDAAEDFAATLGVGRHGWGPMTDRPAREVPWRILGFTAKEGSNDYLAA